MRPIRSAHGFYRPPTLPTLILMTTILDRIVATKRTEVAHAKQRQTESQLRQAIEQLAMGPRPFFDTLAEPGPIKLIAEVKKASPSQGIIREDFAPLDIARTYAGHGAKCISVLTDEPFFQGSLENLRGIRQAVDLPLLRKDFIIDTYQLLEARLAGADAVLLIAECLDDCHLRKLHQETLDLGMVPLVEFYQPENLPRVLEAGATLIGVNNRDLRTFRVDLDHTLRMREQVPDHCLLVGESGIHSRQDVLRLEGAGVDAILVGQSLMEQPDIGQAVDRLMGR